MKGETYIPDKPCNHGHRLRYRSSKNYCVECKRAEGRRQAPARLAYQRRRRGTPASTRPEPEFCEVCGGPSNIALHLDHCHETGKFRGWLCSECNLAIGKLGDNIGGLERALAYLRRAQ